jgi:hypothetical protein
MCNKHKQDFLHNFQHKAEMIVFLLLVVCRRRRGAAVCAADQSAQRRHQSHTKGNAEPA